MFFTVSNFSLVPHFHMFEMNFHILEMNFHIILGEFSYLSDEFSFCIIKLLFIYCFKFISILILSFY